MIYANKYTLGVPLIAVLQLLILYRLKAKSTKLTVNQNITQILMTGGMLWELSRTKVGVEAAGHLHL